MNIKLGPPKLMDLKPRITVIGIGGAGCNAINNMIATELDGVEFIVANTDAQSLAMSHAEHRIQLGVNLTEGLGAGARPEVGEAAAREAEDDIRAEIAGSHMVFIAAGMGGGTGTGAAAVIAGIARDLGILTVGIVSKPFQFEGARRMRTADAGIAALEKVVDTLIVIPNQNLFRIANERTTFAEAFRLADQVLYSGIACIVDLIIKEGLINLDFADVKAVMKGMGTAMMGTGEASGEGRALAAANEAIANPLLDNITLSGAQGLLVSIVGGSDLTLYEVDTAASHIRKEVANDANIIVGATTEPGMDDRIRVSIVASGMSGSKTNEKANQNTIGNSNQNASPPVASHATSHASPNVAPVASQQPAQPHPVKTAPLAPSAPAASGVRSGTTHDRTAVEMDVDAADEFARALSEAMSDTRAPDQDLQAWESTDGVRVEEGFAGRGYAVQPPPLPAAGSTRAARATSDPSAHAPGFEPSKPAEVRRSTARIPDVSDFPEMAQREYFAKMESAQHSAQSGRTPQPEPTPRTGEPVHTHESAPHTQQSAHQHHQQAAENGHARSSIRPGFLRRLAGSLSK